MDKPVYFVFFPQDSPVLSLLPQGFKTEEAFQGIQEAIDYFRADPNQKGREAGEETSTGAVMADEAGDEQDEAEKTESATVLVNCLNYYRNIPLLQKEPDADLLRMITELKDIRGELGIRLLMPEWKNTDQDLLIDLMSRGFLDFWFVTALNAPLLSEILQTRRSFREMEAYLSILPPPVVPSQGEPKGDRLAGFLKGSPSIEKAFGKWLGRKMNKQRGKPTQPNELKILPQPAQAPDLLTQPMQEQEPERQPIQELELQDQAYPPMRQSSSRTQKQTMIPEATDYAIDFYAAAKLAAGKMNALLGQAFAGKKAKHSAKGAVHGKLGSATVQKMLKPVRKKKNTSHMAPAQDSVLFYSEEDCMLAYALAFMTAGYLASRGGKTLLVELPGSGSRLAVTLGLRHPDKNLPGALRDYAFGERREWRSHCFNGTELYRDPRAIDRTDYSKRLPKLLYFLPDDDMDGNLYPHWEGFLASLIHWAVMVEQFSYIVYVGFGGTDSLHWKKGLVCSHKIIIFPPWPSGFNEASALEKNWQKGCLPAFDGTWGMKYIGKEVKNLNLKKHLIIPGAVKDDFIKMAAFEREAEDFSPESLRCLELLRDCLSAK